MDNTYHQAPADRQQPPMYNGGYLETPYNANRAPTDRSARDPTQPDHVAPRWTPSQGYEPYGYRGHIPAPSSGVAGYGGPHMALPYGFDPSVPPPPFGCPPPPGHFPGAGPPHSYGSGGASAFPTFNQQYGGPHGAHAYDTNSSQKLPQPHEYRDFSEGGAPYQQFPPRGTAKDPGKSSAEDEAAVQRRQDQQWIRRFLQSGNKLSRVPQTERRRRPRRPGCVSGLREALYAAARLVSQLAETCGTLRDNVEDDRVWADSYSKALAVKAELEDTLGALRGGEALAGWRAEASRVAQRRARRRRASEALQVEQQQREDLISEKEAAIDKWRTQQIVQVEERKKELELKLAADAVLCEVRKKQADVKRMQDILRSLEKLRKLRKEAASRKGIATEPECDEAFSSRLEQLRCVMKKRTAVYSAEEKALMVMLEGEQEEERRREREKRVKKERERQLQRKRRVDAMLFGDELPADSLLQPFTEYYTQAEHSLAALLQIRREWDVFVVASDHPDGSAVPLGWILPDAPSDRAWAAALFTADMHADGL